MNIAVHRARTPPWSFAIILSRHLLTTYDR